MAKNKQQQNDGTAQGQNISREDLILEVQRLQDENPKIVISRDFWRANAKYTEKQLAKYWTRFKDFLSESDCNL